MGIIFSTMGSVLSFFRRTKKANQQLIELSESYKKLDVQKTRLLARKQWLARHTLRLGIALVFVLLSYLYALPPVSKFLYSCLVFFVIFSLPIVLLIRRGIDHYYGRALTNNFLKHKELDDKIKIKLEEVLDVCSFKEARRLIETYAPHHSARIFGNLKSDAPNAGAPLVARRTITPVRQPPSAPNLSLARPALPSVSSTPAGALAPVRATPSVPPSTFMERLTGLLVGDADSTRYALICSFCYHNNGLALPEEFPFTSFRCVNCSCLNEARAVRPTAPKLAQVQAAISEPSPSTINTEETEEIAAGQPTEDSCSVTSPPESTTQDEDESSQEENEDADAEVIDSAKIHEDVKQKSVEDSR